MVRLFVTITGTVLEVATGLNCTVLLVENSILLINLIIFPGCSSFEDSSSIFNDSFIINLQWSNSFFIMLVLLYKFSFVSFVSCSCFWCLKIEQL